MKRAAGAGVLALGLGWGVPLAHGEEQPPIQIIFDLHMDPLASEGGVDKRAVAFRKWKNSAAWLMDKMDLVGGRVSFLAAGEFMEFCLEDLSDAGSCFPMIQRLYDSGGVIGTHFHDEIALAAHDWHSLTETYGSVADVPESQITVAWTQNQTMADKVVEKALGILDSAEVRAVNRVGMSHLPNVKDDPAAYHDMLISQGFTMQEGGAEQEFHNYFGHSPMTPFRPGSCNLCGDPEGLLFTIPLSVEMGSNEFHFDSISPMDGRVSRKQAELLQIVANRQLRQLQGLDALPWSYGLVVHGHDIDEQAPARAAVEELLPWIQSELVETGLATFASFTESEEQFAAWEVAHPGETPFDYPLTQTNYRRYPYAEWVNHFMRKASLVTMLYLPGGNHAAYLKVDIDKTSDGENWRYFVLGNSVQGLVEGDLTSVFGDDMVQVYNLATGASTGMDAAHVILDKVPQVYCLPDDCAAILALDPV